MQLFSVARCCFKSSDEFHVILHRQGGPKPLRAFRPTPIEALDGLVGLLVVAVRNHRNEGARLAQQFRARLPNLHLKGSLLFICRVPVRAVCASDLLVGAGGDLAVIWCLALSDERGR